MRIAMVVSNQHAIIAGGIGQFLKGFIDQIANPNDIIVDFVLDKKPTTDFLQIINNGGKIYYPDIPLSYKGHRTAFSFGESMNWEAHVNFRNSMMLALSNALYDCIVVNSPEAFAVLSGLTLAQNTKIVFYTHSEYLVGFKNYVRRTFYQEYIDFTKSMMNLPNIIAGTQTKDNVSRCTSYMHNKTPKMLGMPFPEKRLLSKIDVKKNGVLFIGRWEDRKNPKAFINLIQNTKLFAKVMTNTNGAKKFISKFLDLGLVEGVDFEVRSNLIGEEKINFIASAKVFFNPSTLESFGFSMIEGLSQCDTVTLSEYDWVDNFEGFDFIKASKHQSINDIILELHNLDKPKFDNNESVNSYNEKAIKSWLDFLAEPHENKIIKNLSKDNFWVSDALSFEKRCCSIEDIVVLYNHRHEYHITDTKEGQWWSKSNAPQKEYSLSSNLEVFYG